MTVAVPVARSLAAQLLARSARSLIRPVSTQPLLRVDCNCAQANDYSSRQYKFKQTRAYATTSAKPASRPKQHTGRTPTKRTVTTTKKAATTKKPTAKKPAAKKPKKKVVKKVAKKAVPKAKKAPSKAAILRKTRAERTELKAAALLEEPKGLPSTAFQVILAEEAKGLPTGSSLGSSAKSASSKYKALSLEERERYNHEANQNKAANLQAYKRWVQTHSPLEIKHANNARRQLTKKAAAAGKKKHYKSIQDDRLVNSPRNAYTYFFTERSASGDLNGMTIAERGKLAGQEWKKLSAAEKQPFEDLATADKNRYLEEYKTVYGEDSPSKTKTSRKS